MRGFEGGRDLSDGYVLGIGIGIGIGIGRWIGIRVH